MNEIYSITGTLLFDLALYSMVAWPLICLLIWCGCRVWDWVDEAETPTPHFLIFYLSKLLGWKESPRYGGWKYYKGISYDEKSAKCDDINTVVFWTIEFLLPLIFLALYFYIPTIIVGLAALTLYTLRFVRRLHKKFNLHTKDKNAHK